METIFFSNYSQKPGLFFDSTTLASIKDSDSDGLLDIHEKSIGSNPNHPDTDNDGFSDWYEFEEGQSTTLKNATDKTKTVIDGVLGKFEEHECVFDPKRDVRSKKNIYDLAKVCYRLFPNFIYVGVSYHNDIRNNQLKLFSFKVKSDGPDAKQIWYQWSGDYAESYDIKQIKGKEDEYLPIVSSGMEMRVIRDGEFLLPLHHFQNYESLDVIHFGSGNYNGKDQIIDDFHRTFRLTKKKIPNFDSNTISSKKNSAFVQDKIGDPLSNTTFLWDISDTFCYTEGKSLLCKTNFQNSILENDFGLHTLHLRKESTKENYWLQWWDSQGYNVKYWHDGEELKDWSGDSSSMDAFFYKNSIYLRSPFGSLEGFTIQYHVGGKWKDGYKHDFDSTDVFRID